MGNHVFPEIECEIGNILLAVPEVARSRCHNACRNFAHKINHNRQIVRGKIPDHIDIVLKETEIDSHGIKIKEIAHDTVVDELLDPADRPGIEEGMVDHDLELFLFSQFDQVFRFFAV